MSEHQVQEHTRESTADLLRDLSRQLSDLVHEEVQLAKVELARKAKRTGAGAFLLTLGGAFALVAGGAFTVAAIAALGQVMSLWLAALIIGAAVTSVAAAAGVAGRSQLIRGTPLVPEEAIDDTKEEVEWLRTELRSARK